MAQIQLTVKTIPAVSDAVISINGTQGASQKVTSGDNYITVVSASRGFTETTMITSNKADTIAEVVLGCGVEIDSNLSPDTVTVDGNTSSGNIMIKDNTEHSIIMTKAGYRGRESRVVMYDKKVTLQKAFSETSGSPTLTVSSQTQGATITINGQSTNTATLSSSQPAFVSITKEGYYPYKQTILFGNNDVDLYVDLKPKDLESVQLVCSDTKLYSGISETRVYKIFYKLNPDTFRINRLYEENYGSKVPHYDIREGVVFDSENIVYTDPNNCIDYCRVATFPDSSYVPGYSNSKYYIELGIKSHSSGHISLDFSMQDGYATIVSDAALELDVENKDYSALGINGGEEGYCVLSALPKYISLNRGKINLADYCVPRWATSSQAVYFYLSYCDENGHEVAEIDTDGTSLIPKKEGSVTIIQTEFREEGAEAVPLRSGYKDTFKIISFPDFQDLQSVELLVPSLHKVGTDTYPDEDRVFCSYPVEPRPPATCTVYKETHHLSTYYFGYKTTPSNYELTHVDAVVSGTGSKEYTYFRRDDIDISLEITEGSEYVRSTGISSGEFPWPYITFADDIEGQVKVRMCFENINTGAIVRSNELTLNVRKENESVQTSNYFVDWDSSCGPKVDSSQIIMLREGEGFDCSNLIYLNKKTFNGYQRHDGVSRYITVGPSSYTLGYGDYPDWGDPYRYNDKSVNSSMFFNVSSDRTTIIAKSAGCGKVTISYKYGGKCGGSGDGGVKWWKWSTTGVSVRVCVIDNEESLGLDDNFNLRFENAGIQNGEIRIDRCDIPYIALATELYEYQKYNKDLVGESGVGSFITKYLKTYFEGIYRISELLKYNDPNGYFTDKRLKLWWSWDPEGEITNDTSRGYASKVVSELKDGSVYLNAAYGKLEETQKKNHVSIKWTNYTGNPNSIPWRFGKSYNFCDSYGDDLASDFSRWYPMSKLISLIPADTTMTQFDKFGVTSSGVAYIEQIDPNALSIDDRFRVRFAGVGHTDGYFLYHNTLTCLGGGGDYDITVRWFDEDGKGHSTYDSVELLPTKSSIKRGEYVAVKTKFTPAGIDFVSKAWTFNYNDGDWKSASDINKEGILNVICTSRKGVILQSGPNATSGKIGIQFGKSATAYITLESSSFSGGSTPKINYTKISGSTAIVSDQTVTLSGGTAAAWNSGEWRIASIDETGHLKSYTAGVVTIYAVTTDGRLAQETVTTPSTLGEGYAISTNTFEEPEVDENKESVLAADTTEDILFHFSSDSDTVVFSSPGSNPKQVDIVRESLNFDLTSMSVISTNPNVATATVAYSVGGGQITRLYSEITPVGKGSAEIKLLYGGAPVASMPVTVEGGTETAWSPNLEYINTYGVSLNVFEYANVKIKVKSQTVYNQMTVATHKGEVEAGETMVGLIATKTGYNSSTKEATIKIELREHKNGIVCVRYGSEELILSVANRYWLKFEHYDSFEIGKGATRDAVLYPVDETIKLSDVWVMVDENANIDKCVSVGALRADVVNGKRAFIVPVTYIKEGEGRLKAGAMGRTDIYLNFTCIAADIPPQSIEFSSPSIEVSLGGENDNNN